MALIEYRINVDVNGNATVIQDIREIGPGDLIRFVADNKANTNPTAIRFDGPSPFDPAGPATVPVHTTSAGPTTGVVLTVPAVGAASPAPIFPVTNHIANAPKRVSPEFEGELRKTFHFQCGEVNSTGVFTLWGGAGAGTSSGGSG